ncbi:MAG: hypothetical protein KJO77_06475, partial [Bacteroidia bacterium]|nr:hypothetical protein [Bacteroidia bacterium]
IYISLNPLPGGMIGWYKYAPDLRLNPFAPFTLHGQVFNMGITFTSLFFLILGLIFAHFERIIRNYLVANQRGISFVLVLLLSLFLFYSFEYYLRSAVRYIYYAYFIWFFYKSGSYFLRGIKNKLKG